MAAAGDLQRLWSEGASAYTASAYGGGTNLMPLNRELAGVLVGTLRQVDKAQVLDVASGSGEPACSIAALAPSAEVTATDYAEGMVAEAECRARSLQLRNMRFAVADAKSLHNFKDNTFDGLCCASALQLLAPDHTQAINEFKRVLKPGGSLVVSVWGLPNQTNCASLMGQVTQQLLPPPKPQAAQTSAAQAFTLGLGDPQVLKAALQAGGFGNTDTRDFNCVFDVSADELASNPMMVRVSQQMSLQGQTDCHKKVVAAITDAARDHSYLKPNGRLLFPTNVAVIATAQA